MTESLLKGLLRSLRGVPIEDRPNLLRQMAKWRGVPEASLPGAAFVTCLYCQDTTRCDASLKAGGGAEVAKFCTNLHNFRAR